MSWWRMESKQRDGEEREHLRAPFLLFLGETVMPCCAITSVCGRSCPIQHKWTTSKMKCVVLPFNTNFSLVYLLMFWRALERGMKLGILSYWHHEAICKSYLFYFWDFFFLYVNVDAQRVGTQHPPVLPVCLFFNIMIDWAESIRVIFCTINLKTQMVLWGVFIKSASSMLEIIEVTESNAMGSVIFIKRDFFLEILCLFFVVFIFKVYFRAVSLSVN